MSDHPRKQLKELTRFLEDYGITVIASATGGRHRKLRISNGQKTALLVVSISASDRRSIYNMVKDARAALREAP